MRISEWFSKDGRRLPESAPVSLGRVLFRFLCAIFLIWRGASAEEDLRVPTDMALIPSGTFWVGSNRGDINESPLHRVFLDSFAIDRWEVSQKEYRAFVTETGRKMPEMMSAPRFGGDALPAVGVTWEEAEAYCRWAGKRLPTEAEWEKAARGEDGRTFPWGEDPPTMQHLNFADMLKAPVEIGSYPGGASPYGVEDMAGNAAEWVSAWYDPQVYTSDSVVNNPRGPATGQLKVVRGGSWQSREYSLRAPARVAKRPGERSATVGFRCAMTPGTIQMGIRRTAAPDSLSKRER